MNIINEMYSKLPNLVLGFHGCHKDVFEAVVKNGQHLKRSENEYDWLGNGIYFWENSYERAYDWAKVRYHENASVVGAVIDLGYCLNLTDYNSLEVLHNGYNMLAASCENTGDCSVIEMIHNYNEKMGFESYDSIRGIFTEGKEAYPGSGFVEKTHVQLCIVNPNCIKGYFAPMPYNSEYRIP